MTDTKSPEPRGARRITTAFFRDMDYIKTHVIGAKKAVVLGQIVGVVYQTVDKVSQMADGKTVSSTCLVGEFEAVNDLTGETITSNICYLPEYFAQVVKGQFRACGEKALPFLANIGAEPSDKAIPWAWTCTPIRRRDPESLINMLKRMAAEEGKLRLTPPDALPERRIEYEPQDLEELFGVEEAKAKKHGKAA